MRSNSLALVVVVILLSATLHGASSAEPADLREVPAYEWGPKDIFAWIEVPTEVTVGDMLTVRIVVENRRSAGRFIVDELWIEESFFAGFQLVAIEPMAVEMDTSLGELDLVFKISIPPRGREEFEIQLRAARVGIYIGDVDIWEADDEEDSIERVAQTEIKAAA